MQKVIIMFNNIPLTTFESYNIQQENLPNFVIERKRRYKNDIISA